jgi:hypothetical protein
LIQKFGEEKKAKKLNKPFFRELIGILCFLQDFDQTLKVFVPNRQGFLESSKVQDGNDRPIQEKKLEN